jgi:hypothetical protein
MVVVQIMGFVEDEKTFSTFDLHEDNIIELSMKPRL